MTTPNEIYATIRITGMHCGSCEILLERKLKSVRGIKRISVNYRTGVATLVADATNPPSSDEIEAIVKKAGYGLADEDGFSPAAVPGMNESQGKWLEIGASLIIILALWKFFLAFDLVSLAPSTSGTLSLGGILLIGIVAGASSCLAVTGGLLLAAAAKYNEVHASMTKWERFKPLLQFNVGRLVSYFFLGGIVGIIGKSITLGARTTGYLNIGIALVMLYIALTILKLIPKGSFGIKPPKALSHWIHDLAEHDHPLAPFVLGGLTFFLPCGFTQSMQLVALASGSFWAGATVMFTFALGTLPALLGISAISSSASGASSRLFLRFAGTLVLILAVFNLNSALTLTGFDVAEAFSSLIPRSTDTASDPDSGQTLPVVTDGVQEVSMRVHPRGYDPSVLTVKAGIPVKWNVDGTNAYGCISSLVIPSMGISKTLTSGQNVIEFTPTQAGRLLFSCSMGMYRGYFNVL